MRTALTRPMSLSCGVRGSSYGLDQCQNQDSTLRRALDKVPIIIPRWAGIAFLRSARTCCELPRRTIPDRSPEGE